MKVIPVVLVTAVMILAITSGVATADDQSSHVEAQPFPSITLNITGGTFYNLSFMGLVLVTPNGTHVASLNHGNWNFTSTGNGTYTYNNTVKFTKDNSLDAVDFALAMNGKNSSHGNGGNGHNNTGNSTNGNSSGNSTDGKSGGDSKGASNRPINADVVIEMKTLDYSMSNMSIGNISAGPNNYSFPKYSILEITLSVTFQKPVNGPGKLELIQMIKGSGEGNSGIGYYYGKIIHGNQEKSHEDNQGVQVPARSNNSANRTMNALYWWNSTYSLNGVQKNLTSTINTKDGAVYIMFDFSFNNSTSLKSVYQDPYIGIPGQPIFKNPIVKKVVGEVVNYLVINAEYFATGLASGVVLLGASYSFYRRRRF